MIDIMIFSKNRALQLYALLESIEKYTGPQSTANIYVLYNYDDDHLESLGEVKNRFSQLKWVKETIFKDNVTNFMSGNAELVAFLTDDIIFKDDIDFTSINQLIQSNPGILAFSLRLGLHIQECYALNSAQPFPQGNVYPPNIFVWPWRNAQMDWEYAFSVDGHVFRKNQFRSWISKLEYHHPNSFEEAMQLCRNIPNLPDGMVCFALSKLVNLPVNRVQSSHQNRCGEMTAAELLDIWNSEIGRAHV